MSNKAIVVQSKGTSTVGSVLENTPKVRDISNDMEEGVMNVLSIASGDSPLKRCPSCAKQGVQPFHPIADFSIVKSTGKPHSYCKRCKAEQASEWQRRKEVRERRRLYQQTYHTTYVPTRVTKPVVDAVQTTIDSALSAEPEIDALFVAITK
jgi:hypothetical protein